MRAQHRVASCCCSCGQRAESDRASHTTGKTSTSHSKVSAKSSFIRSVEGSGSSGVPPVVPPYEFAASSALARSSASGHHLGAGGRHVVALEVGRHRDSRHPERVTVGPAAVLLLQVNDRGHHGGGRGAARDCAMAGSGVPIFIGGKNNLAGYVATRIEVNVAAMRVLPACCTARSRHRRASVTPPRSFCGLSSWRTSAESTTTPTAGP